MFNPDKKVETIDDWYEAVITDFHDRSESSLSFPYNTGAFEDYEFPVFKSTYHRGIVILFLIELSKVFRATRIVKIDIPTFRKKIISIYGTRLIDELDYVEKYSHRIAKVKNITTDITAIQITHGIPYDTIDSDMMYSYLDRYDFVKQTADDLQDYFLQNIKGHVKWVLKNSGLDYVR